MSTTESKFKLNHHCPAFPVWVRPYMPSALTFTNECPCLFQITSLVCRRYHDGIVP